MHTPQHFNIQELEILSRGDHAFIVKMMEAFCNTVPGQLNSMQSAFSAPDFVQLAGIAHRLQPSFHYLGRPDLSALLGEIENEDASRSNETILEAAAQFLGQVQALLEEAKAFSEKIKNA